MNEIKTDPHSGGRRFSGIPSRLVFLGFDFHLVAKKYGDLPE